MVAFLSQLLLAIRSRFTRRARLEGRESPLAPAAGSSERHAQWLKDNAVGFATCSIRKE